MLAQFWTMVRRAAIAVGVALSLFAVVELIRAYQALNGLHPVLGALFAWLLILGLAGLLVYYRLAVYRWRTVLTPPPREAPETAGEGALRRYLRYLRRVMLRLARNDLLPERQREGLQSEAQRLLELAAARPGREVLAQAVASTEIDVVEPAMATLDGFAEKEVRACVRDVMLAVTLSPWRSADLLVVMYRNTAMVGRLTRIYESRPRLGEQFAIMRDVAAIVATVNFLNYGSRLLQNMATGVLPFMGRFADDVAQGVGAGLLTSVAGHAAIGRCRAFRGWRQAEAEETVRRKLKDFAVDLKDIATTDLFSKIRKPVESQLPVDVSRPELLVRIRDGLATALDETAEVMDTFVRRPVTVAGRGAVSAGSWVGDALWNAARTGAGGAAAAGRAAARVAASAAGQAGRTVGRGAAAAASGARRYAGLAAERAGRFRRKPQVPPTYEAPPDEPEDEEPDV